MEKVIVEIMHYCKQHDLVSPVTTSDIINFEKANHLVLPTEYKLMLTFFDGGEIFIPGPVIYGISQSPIRQQIKTANSSEKRSLYSIPDNYLIIARLNYGDLICINLNEPYDVIQWDHESNQLFCTWSNLSEWLNDNIEAFNQYKENE